MSEHAGGKVMPLITLKIKRKVMLLVSSICQLIRVLFYKALSTAYVEGNPDYCQPVLLPGLGRVIFLGKVEIGYYPSPGFFSTYAHIEARNKTSKITIGNGTIINNNFCAIAEHSNIFIGRNCLIGTNVEILDSDFHGLKVSERNQSKPEWAKPVKIMDNVFIGSNAKIMKGVTIGSGAVISNGAIVTKDVPADSIVAGNPAQVVKLLNENTDE